MAPNKKKKKVASNPARGFATVSQPSKAKENQGALDEVHPADEQHEVRDTTKNKPQTDKATISDQVPDLKYLSPEEFEAHLEDAELQNIIDAHSARCKQDALRQVHKLDTERRQLRSQSYRLSTVNWLPHEIVDKILQETRLHKTMPSTVPSSGLIEDTSILAKLWTVEIVLEQLHLPCVDSAIAHLAMLATRNRVESTSNYIWGLQEALQFYAFENEQLQLPDYESSAIAASTINADLTEEFQFAESEPKHLQTDSASEPAVPKPQDLAHDLALDDTGSEQSSLPELAPTDSENDDPSELTENYLRLQQLLFHTEDRINQKDKPHSDLEQRRRILRRRLDAITRDVLFDADSAGSLWRDRLRDLKIHASKSVKSKQPVQEGSEPEVQTEQLEADNLPMLGDMFGDTDDVQFSQHKSIDQPLVTIIDFGKWNGIQPRRLLEECLPAFDPTCVQSFQTITATPYSARQKLTLKWSSTHMLDALGISALPKEVSCVSSVRGLALDMTAIATTSLMQAEAYLSTLALFILVSSGYAEHKQSIRLPTVWRELYADLGEKWQALVDKNDRDTLRALRKLLADAQARSKSADCLMVSTHKSMRGQTLPQRTAKQSSHLTAEEARMQWHSRTSSESYQAMLPVRQQLPVHHYQNDILESVQKNQLVIICADTGAGKSTQIPSYVLAHQLSAGSDCRILVTQPRRISAISLARRVSQELGERKNDLGTDRSLVGYAIRLESKTSQMTRITFATTGVLLRMIESTPQLDDLNVLILDEVHERSMDIDMLFISLRQLLRRRTDLKVILMSATVDADKFAVYFGGAPILRIPGRTFPVQICYLEDAIENTLDIAVPGEVSTDLFDEGDDDDYVQKDASNLGSLDSYSSATRSRLASMNEHRIDYNLTASLAEAIATKESFKHFSSAILIFMPGIGEIRRLHNTLLTRDVFASKWTIHLLHSSFSTEDLERAFAVPPLGHRKIVIATNIAETGITIPDVTAVIDTCKEKIMRFDERRQLSRLTEGFISRSSARQRRGRAARVQDGLCFHLVTKHRFENLLLEQNVPEMLRLSLQDPILRIKIWNLGSIEETLAAAIDPPTIKNVRRAVDKLKDAGALSANDELTPLGKIIARLPLEVVLSKLVTYGVVFQCLDAALTIVAILTSKSIFLNDKSGQRTDPRIAFARADSDLISSLNAYDGWRKAKLAGLAHHFCKKHYLSDQSLGSVEDQKVQLTTYLVDAGLLQLDKEEKATLSRCRISDRHRSLPYVPDRYNVNTDDAVLSSIIALAFYPKVLVREGKGWRNVYSNQRVNLTTNSVNRAAAKPATWLCFYEAMQTRSGALSVLETSKIPESVIVTLMGHAEFRFYSGTIGLDNGKMKFSLKQWKQMAAIKSLRESLKLVLDRCWQTPGLEMSTSDRVWVTRFVGIVAGRNQSSK